MQGIPQSYVNKMDQTACDTSVPVAPASGTPAGATMMQVFAYGQDVFLEPGVGSTATSTSPVIVKAGFYSWVPVGQGYAAIAQAAGGFVSAMWWGG